MTKGVLGLVLPLLIVGGSLLLAAQRPKLGELGLWWGVPLFSVLVVPWHWLASRENPGFLSYYLLETHIIRFLWGTGAIEDEIPLSAGAFLLVTLVWFLPWSLFLPSALVALRREWCSFPVTERSGWTLVCVWIAVVLGFFSLSSFKLEHYGLPAFPALALLVAALWSYAPNGWLVRIPVFLGAAGALLLLLIAGSAGTGDLSGLLQPFNVYFRTLLEEGAPLPLSASDGVMEIFRWMAFALLLGFGAAAAACWRGAALRAFACLMVGTVGFLSAVGALTHSIAPLQSARGIAEALQRVALPTDLLVYEGFLENAAGLPYYTGRRIHLLALPRGDLAFSFRFREAGEFFHAPETLAQIWERHGRVFLVTERLPERSAVQSLSPQSRHLLLDDHGKRVYSNRQN
jgi:4-amino-4-deoxy-L-arabinose transferase-like glycosyltransferase